MNRPSALVRGLLAFAVAAALVACGDDDGGTTDSGTPPPPPADTGPGVDTGTPPPPPPPPGANACTNADDMGKLGMMFGPMMDKAVADVAADCAIECFLDGTEACVTSCVVRDTMLSMGCATCFTASVSCVRDNCLTLCATPLGGDPDSPACLACQCGDNDAMMNCRDVFTACSGVPSTGCSMTPTPSP